MPHLCRQEGNTVHVKFDFATGDAAGQNQVTFVSTDLVKHIVDETPVKPTRYVLENGLSSDKKASAISLMTVRATAGCRGVATRAPRSSHSSPQVRGRKVVADCTIPASVVREVSCDSLRSEDTSAQQPDASRLAAGSAHNAGGNGQTSTAWRVRGLLSTLNSVMDD